MELPWKNLEPVTMFSKSMDEILYHESHRNIVAE